MRGGSSVWTSWMKARKFVEACSLGCRTSVPVPYIEEGTERSSLFFRCPASARSTRLRAGASHGFSMERKSPTPDPRNLSARPATEVDGSEMLGKRCGSSPDLTRRAGAANRRSTHIKEQKRRGHRYSGPTLLRANPSIISIGVVSIILLALSARCRICRVSP
jgi:hypothetical protein